MKIRSMLPGFATFIAITCSCDVGASRGALAADGSPQETLQLKLRFNGDDVPFGRVGAIVADTGGRIYVADTQAQTIVVISGEGDILGTMGGPGGGPGEFTALGPTLAWSGDELLTWDSRNPRISRFSGSGEALGTQAWPALSAGMIRTLFSADANAYAQALPPAQVRRLSVDAAPAPLPRRAVTYHTIRKDGTSAPITSLVDSIPGDQVTMCMTPDRSVVHILELPFASRGPLRAFLPSGELAVVRSDEYQIDVIDTVSGGVLRRIVRDAAPVPLDDVTWESLPAVRELLEYEREAGADLVGLGDVPCPLRTSRPQFIPAIHSLTADEGGRLWVESMVKGGGARLAIFDPADRLVAETVMPERDRSVAPYVHGNLLYIVTADEYGVQSIEVYEASFAS